VVSVLDYSGIPPCSIFHVDKLKYGVNDKFLSIRRDSLSEAGFLRQKCPICR
jgi:hypothetical protein